MCILEMRLRHENIQNLGMILLGVWLIASGLIKVLSISIPLMGTILAVLAIVAGGLILLGS
jgi:hypothetical protein